jgi:hypothetical protein
MTAIRIETIVDSETLYLPQLKPLVGKSVEIIVRPIPDQMRAIDNTSAANPLAGSVLEYAEPLEPAVPPSDWEASR